MTFTDMLKIPDAGNDSLWGVIAIIALTMVVYAVIYARIAQKRDDKIQEAKRIAIESIERRKLLGEDDQSDEGEDNDEEE